MGWVGEDDSMESCSSSAVGAAAALLPFAALVVLVTVTAPPPSVLLAPALEALVSIGTGGAAGTVGTVGSDCVRDRPKPQDRRRSLSRLRVRARGTKEGPASAFSSTERRRPTLQLKLPKSEERREPVSEFPPVDPADDVLVRGKKDSAADVAALSLLGPGTAATGIANDTEFARGGGAGMPLGPVPGGGRLLGCGGSVVGRGGLGRSLTGRRRGGWTTKCAFGLT